MVCALTLSSRISEVYLLIIHYSNLDACEANAAFNAGRIGAKASRVIRMVPLVRLVKLGKVTFQRSRGKDSSLSVSMNDLQKSSF
jgi:hypothetical protein